MKTAYEIVRRPIITEQSMESIDNNRYVFEVDKRANKIEIKKAVEEILGSRSQKSTPSTTEAKLNAKAFTSDAAQTGRRLLLL